MISGRIERRAFTAPGSLWLDRASRRCSRRRLWGDGTAAMRAWTEVWRKAPYATLPRPMATKQRSPFSKDELSDFRTRLELERSELEEQLTTIEENSFAASQSDMTGEVAFDDET